MSKKALVITAVVALGLIILVLSFISTLNKVTHYATRLHEDILSQSAADVYKTHVCPAAQSVVTPSQFAQFATYYKERAAEDIMSFDPSDSKLDPRKIMDKFTVNQEGTFGSTVYRTGALDVGVALKSTESSYCVVGIEAIPLDDTE